jgi:hypothetical protein
MMMMLVEHRNEVDVVMVVGERRRVPTRNRLPMMAKREATPSLRRIKLHWTIKRMPMHTNERWRILMEHSVNRVVAEEGAEEERKRHMMNRARQQYKKIKSDPRGVLLLVEHHQHEVEVVDVGVGKSRRGPARKRW